MRASFFENPESFSSPAEKEEKPEEEEKQGEPEIEKEEGREEPEKGFENLDRLTGKVVQEQYERHQKKGTPRKRMMGFMFATFLALNAVPAEAGGRGGQAVQRGVYEGTRVLQQMEYRDAQTIHQLRMELEMVKREITMTRDWYPRARSELQKQNIEKEQKEEEMKRLEAFYESRMQELQAKQKELSEKLEAKEKSLKKKQIGRSVLQTISGFGGGSRGY